MLDDTSNNAGEFDSGSVLAAAESAADIETVPTVKAERVRNVVDLAAGTITRTVGTESTVYSIADIPGSVVPWLALRGLSAVLLGDGHAEMFAKLVAGTIPTRGPVAGAKKEKPLDPLRLAYATHLVARAKKSGVEIALDAAKAKAATLDKEEIKVIRRNPDVIKILNKLTGFTPELPAASVEE